MDPRLNRLKREANKWGLRLEVIPGDPDQFELGYPQSTSPFRSASLAEVQSLLWAHRNALAGHRGAAA